MGKDRVYLGRYRRHESMGHSVHEIYELIDFDRFMDHELLSVTIVESLSVLRYREREAIELYYGLYDGTSYTLQQIADSPDFQCCRENVRQMIEKALSKLRRRSKDKLREFKECL